MLQHSSSIDPIFSGAFRSLTRIDWLIILNTLKASEIWMVRGSPSGTETIIRMTQMLKLLTNFVKKLPPAAVSMSILMLRMEKMNKAEKMAYFMN